jgi:hypothetical protein
VRTKDWLALPLARRGKLCHARLAEWREMEVKATKRPWTYDAGDDEHTVGNSELFCDIASFGHCETSRPDADVACTSRNAFPSVLAVAGELVVRASDSTALAASFDRCNDSVMLSEQWRSSAAIDLNFAARLLGLLEGA